MITFVILHQNHALAEIIKRLYEDKGKLALKIVGESPEPTKIASNFESLSDWIESELSTESGNSGVLDAVVITDIFGYDNVSFCSINPLKPHDGWATVLGMLILGFPEIHWIFMSGTLNEETQRSVNKQETTIIPAHFSVRPDDLAKTTEFHKNGLSPIFDATGLRNAIPRNNPKDEVNESPCRRRSLAIAIDDEKSYAWLHAYTAYRFGFRSQAVTTDAGMKVALNDPYPQPTLVFEDYFLQFGDVHHEGFSKLRTRDTYDSGLYERLGKAGFRILVTSGHHHGQDKEASEDNPVYLRELRAKGQWNKELNKPLGGIFNLWKDSGLQRKLQDGGRRGLARGYHWPPNPKELDDDKGGHSAPGRLLVIADRLIARAERLLSNGVHSVPQAVYGAVLATDALELLGGKTPTTSLEALALKHQFEVLAECQFVGMQQHMDVEARMKDIQLEIKALCYWFGTKRQQKNVAGWNAELAILNKLIAVFREQNQFDEEQALLVRTRVLHRKLRFSKYPFIFRPLEIFPWYVEKLVASFPTFLFAILAWLSAASVAWWSIEGSWKAAISGVWSAFFSGTAATSCWSLISLSCVIIASGFLHLGVFVAYIYSLISRR